MLDSMSGNIFDGESGAQTGSPELVVIMVKTPLGLVPWTVIGACVMMQHITMKRHIGPSRIFNDDIVVFSQVIVIEMLLNLNKIPHFSNKFVTLK